VILRNTNNIINPNSSSAGIKKNALPKPIEFEVIPMREGNIMPPIPLVLIIPPVTNPIRSGKRVDDKDMITGKR